MEKYFGIRQNKSINLEMIMKFYVFIFFFALSLNAYATSKKYKGGEVDIVIKHKKVCFYLKNDSLKGQYELNVFQKESFDKIFHYSNTFEKMYPDQSQCIAVNENLFKPKTIYTVILDTGYTNFGKDFCVLKAKNQNNIANYDGNRCVEPKFSLSELFFNFLKSL